MRIFVGVKDEQLDVGDAAVGCIPPHPRMQSLEPFTHLTSCWERDHFFEKESAIRKFWPNFPLKSAYRNPSRKGFFVFQAAIIFEGFFAVKIQGVKAFRSHAFSWNVWRWFFLKDRTMVNHHEKHHHLGDNKDIKVLGHLKTRLFTIKKPLNMWVFGVERHVSYFCCQQLYPQKPATNCLKNRAQTARFPGCFQDIFCSKFSKFLRGAFYTSMWALFFSWNELRHVGSVLEIRARWNWK